MKTRLITICLFLLVVPGLSFAKDYDFYVDKDYSGDEEGSEEKPFNKVSEAIEEADKEGGRQEIYIKNGDYKEELTIGGGIRLYGQNEDKVTLHGPVVMKNNTKIESLTVSGGRAAVRIVKDADAEIENCTIRDFSPTGIEAKAGGGRLTVIGSKIKKGNGKGFYIERGKKITIIGNEVYENDQEGIDIRSKVRGEVKNNLIYENDESGIELIISEADLVISGNTIKNNDSSGIATQFYKELDQPGSVRISANAISGNENYGVDCKIPQGGSPPSSFWRDSIDMTNNSVNGNEKGAVNNFCSLVVEEKDEAENVASNGPDDKEKKEKIEEIKRAEEEMKQKVSQAEIILNQQLEINLSIEEKISEIEGGNQFQKFFIGIKKERIRELSLKIEKSEKLISQAQGLLNETNPETDGRENLLNEIENRKEKTHEQAIFLYETKNAFSLWGWIKEKTDRYFGYIF